MPPFLDRPAVERAFGVGRRQAIRLMGAMGGYQVGKTYLVDREALVAELERMTASGVVAEAVRRKQRILAAVNQAKQAQIAADPEALSRQTSSLPSSIQTAAPGVLQIHYRNAEDLLAQVVELVSAAANDFEEFQRRFGSAP